MFIITLTERYLGGYQDKNETGSNLAQIHVFTYLGACKGHIFAQIFVNVEVM